MTVLSSPAPEVSHENSQSPAEPNFRRRVLRTFKHSWLKKNLLSVIDQGFVSGTRFATTILIGRLCGSEELGIYSLGFSILVFIGCVQESLISLPYTLFSSQLKRRDRRQLAGSVLSHSVLLALVSMFILLIAGLVVHLGYGPQGLENSIWVVMGLVPFVLLREFARRFAFAHLKIRHAVVVDGTMSAVQIGGLCLLIATNSLSALTAYIVMGIACSVAGLGWLYLARWHFQFEPAHVLESFKSNWKVSRWVLAGQLVHSLDRTLILWLLALMVGYSSTGIFMACLTIALFSNPLVLAFSNVLLPQTARAFSSGGVAAVRRVRLQGTLILGLGMLVFAVVASLFSEQILTALYKGNEFQGYGDVVSVLALGILGACLGIASTHALWAINKPNATFTASLITVGVALIVAALLINQWGVLGGAIGYCCGNVVGSIYRIVAFSILAGRLETSSHTA